MTKDLQKMIDSILNEFKWGSHCSVDHLYTVCTAKSSQAPIFFRAFGELLASGRLEKLVTDVYRLKV